MRIKLIAIQRYFPHWSQHSGYHQYLKHLNPEISVDHVQIPPDNAPIIKNPFMRILVRYLYRHRTTAVTTHNDIYNELRILKRLKSYSPSFDHIFLHFLDGEHVLNFSPLLFYFYRRISHNIKIGVTYHQPPSVLKTLLRRSHPLSLLNAVFLVGRNQINFFPALYTNKLIFIPHGVDTDFFKPNLSNTKSHKISCITVGQWLRDFDSLWQIIIQAPPNYHFNIVGIRDHILRFDGLHNVTLYSGISDEQLLTLYQSADIGLLPLLEATANNSLLEMMATGLPIITNDVGGIGDYVDRNSVFLHPPGDTTGMMNSLSSLGLNPNLRHRMGRLSRQKALRFSWRSIGHQMSSAYLKHSTQTLVGTTYTEMSV